MATRQILGVLLLVVCGLGGFFWWSTSGGGDKPVDETVNRKIDEDRQAELKAAELDPAKQKEIWEAEHITFEIEKVFGKAFVKTFLEKQTDRLAIHFRETFHGELFDEGKTRQREIDDIRETRIGPGDRRKVEADREGLVKFLTDELNRFEKVERWRFRVLKIDRKSPESNRWNTQILFSMFGTDKQKGKRYFQSEQNVVFVIEDESKIAVAPILERWVVESETTRTGGSPLMKEATEQYGLDSLDILDNWILAGTNIPSNSRVGDAELDDVQLYRFQVSVADYNRDGHLDIAIGTLEGTPILLRSEKGERFVDVANLTGLRNWKEKKDNFYFCTAWIDFDNDGWPDLLMGNRLYRNLDGNRFQDVTANSGLILDPECMGCLVADYDCDGLLDLYMLYQRSYDGARVEKEQWVNETETGKENRLWHNEGNGRFRDVTLESYAGGGRRHTHAAVWFYHDDDKYPDLYIANDFGKNVLLQNNGDGTFKDISEESGSSGYSTSMGVAVGDVNNNGKSEIYVANMYSKMGRRIIGMVSKDDYPEGIYEQILGSCAGNRLYRWDEKNSRYHEIGEDLGINAVGWAYGPLMFDLQSDGWLDLYATTGLVSFNRDEPDG